MDEALLKLQDCSNQGTFLNKTRLVHMHRLFFTTLKSMLTAILWRIGDLLQDEGRTTSSSHNNMSSPEGPKLHLGQV